MISAAATANRGIGTRSKSIHPDAHGREHVGGSLPWPGVRHRGLYAKLPWHQRKQAYLAKLTTASPDALLVSVADKLHNARAVLADYRRLNDGIWKRFNKEASKQDRLNYYRKLVTTFRTTTVSRTMVDEFDQVVTELEHLATDRPAENDLYRFVPSGS